MGVDRDGWINGMREDRRASVPLIIALSIPMLAAVTALGVEVTAWSTVKLEAQRIADAAALAGVIRYAESDSAQAGAAMAMKIAELSGLTGGGTATWDAATQTYSNAVMTARLEAGLKDATNNKAVYVEVLKQGLRGMSSLFAPNGIVTIKANAKAELDGAQPCLVTLHTAALTISNIATINAGGCAIWSNGTVVGTNNINVTVGDVYSAGAITTANSAVINARKHPNSSAVADPYAQDPEVSALIAGLSGGAGTAISTSATMTLSPGTYSSLVLTNSANVTLLPGTYYINGNISVRNSSILTGTGVTIVTSGSVEFQQSSVVNLTAANGDVGGAVGGILLVSTASNITLENSGTRGLTGIIYAPNATLSIQNAATLVSTTCLQYIVGRADISNHALMSATNCVSMGARSFGRKRLLVL